MKTSVQIKADRFLVKPLAWLVNVFVRIAGKLLRINHSLEITPIKIAVCKYKGMGSIIQATPLIQALKIRFPLVKIVFVSTESNRKLLEKLPVDEMVLLNDQSFLQLLTSFPGFIVKLIRHKPDHYLDLEIYAHFSSIISAFSLSGNRLGFYQRDSQYRMGIYTHMVFFNNAIPVSESYLQMARLLGFEGESPAIFDLSQNIHVRVSDLNSGYLVVNPNASDLRPERKWPVECFISLCNELSSSFPDFKVVLIGSKSETFLPSKIMNEVNDKKNFLNLAGKTTFEELISVLRHAKLVITNDTGPMHLSNACNTPTIGLFGPCSPKQYGLGEFLIPVYKQWYCSPCVHEFMIPPCKGDNICMKSISVEEVMIPVRQVLKGNYIDKKLNYPKVNYIRKGSGYFPGLIKRS